MRYAVTTDSVRNIKIPDSLLDRLVQAIACLTNYPKELKQEADIEKVRQIYALLNDIERKIPDVKAWCVVKHYAMAKGDSWKPAVWAAHLTKEQAEEFCPLIDKHYNGEINYGHRYKVEYRSTCISNIVPTNLSGEDYVDGLGS